MGLLNLRKKKDEKKHTITYNSEASISTVPKTEFVNDHCPKVYNNICSIKVLGSGCVSCHTLYENTQYVIKAEGELYRSRIYH